MPTWRTVRPLIIEVLVAVLTVIVAESKRRRAGAVVGAGHPVSTTGAPSMPVSVAQADAIRENPPSMYSVDERDRVAELKDVPQSDVGAPCPLVLASEGKLIVVYFVNNPPEGWDGTTVTVVDPDTSAEPAAIVRFSRVTASMFGPPNDEAFSGHPLAGRGLHPYGAFEVLDSSWVRRLERMNAVHPQHRPERYATCRHFVLAFHDSTLECIARGYTCEVAQGPLTALIGRLSGELAG